MRMSSSRPSIRDNNDKLVLDLDSDLQESLKKYDFFAGRLLVGWYNKLRLKVSPNFPQLIENVDHQNSSKQYEENLSNMEAKISEDLQNDNVAYVIGVKPSFFDRKVIPRITEESPNRLSSLQNNVIENVSYDILQSALNDFHKKYGHLKIRILNLDKPPYIHAQTLGHISGLVQFINSKSLVIENLESWIQNYCSKNDGFKFDLDKISNIRKFDDILGLSLHPEYGGWFAFRYLIIFGGLLVPNLPRPQELSFLTNEEIESSILEYNLRPEIGLWRDIRSNNIIKGRHFNEFSYSAEAYLYFQTTDPEIRRRYWSLKFREIDKETDV